MVQLRKCVVALAGLLYFAIYGLGQPAPQTFQRDFQLWNDTQISVPLDAKKKWNATLWVFGRFGNQVRTTTDARAGGLITRKINNYLTLGGGYLYRYSNPTFVRRNYEHRYLGLAAVTVPLGRKFTLLNRNLYQYESRHARPNATIIRNRFWLKREITIKDKKVEPFGSYESFYDTRLGAFARHRFQFGFSRKFNDNFSGDFYYVRQNEGGNNLRPGDVNAIGASLRIGL